MRFFSPFPLSQIVSYATERLVPLDIFTVHAMDDGDNLLTSFSNYYINTTAVLSSATTSKTVVPLSSSSPTSNSSTHFLPQLLLVDQFSPTITMETYQNITMHTEVSSTQVTTYNTTITFRVTMAITTDRVITASLNDTSREAYPYTISDNTVFNREAVLVASQNYPRNGSMSVTLSSGKAVFPGAFRFLFQK